MRSIKLQEAEEEQKSRKKKVTILSVEEEEALVQQINDIRDRIRHTRKLKSIGGSEDVVSSSAESQHFRSIEH